jgi:hypothetical protein
MSLSVLVGYMLSGEVCVYDTTQTPGVCLVLIAYDTRLCTTDCKEGYVLGKLQHGLISMELWCEYWNVRINEDITQAVYFFSNTD